ncbi:MAG TPA: conjugal transfer protein TraH, partial [Candidatus Nitrosotenuis sp.]|nr:conjugal transfer protein TraH [Candidatus Nitrosotenuis sp.]
GAFQDQAAGYYTGGGYVMRQGNTAIQPINISLPRLGVGCNNLDLYFGSFSFLKGDQLVSLARQIGTGVPTYAFQLALKTMAPQIENLLAQLRKYVQDMNNMMLNSCQMSQQIVGGLWPKGTAASEQICMDQKRGGNEDWFGARKHCEDARGVASQVESAKTKYKDLLMGEYNLVWHVLKKMPEYSGNKELAKFILSVTGTLISKKEGERFRLRIIEPRADQKDFIGAYLKGGVTSHLSCDEDEKCLNPKIRQITIQQDQTMKTKIFLRIQDLRQKYIDKENIGEDDINFLNDAVSLPVYRYIQVSVAAGTHFLMEDSAEYIAAMVLLTQFDRVMSEVIEAVDTLQKIQLEDTAIEQFKQNLQQARGRVQALLVGANNGSIMTLNQAIQAIEQSIIAKNS